MQKSKTTKLKAVAPQTPLSLHRLKSVSRTIPISFFRIINETWYVCSVWTNFQRTLVPDASIKIDPNKDVACF